MTQPRQQAQPRVRRPWQPRTRLQLASALLLAGVLGAPGCQLSIEGDDSELLDDSISSQNLSIIGPSQETVAAGSAHSCAISGDRTVQCWGAGSYGRLGNGTTSNSSVPVDVTGITDAVAITAGSRHSCALRASGTVACWGHNAYGQLGNGSTTQRTTPVTVSRLSGVVAISAGSYHTCALQATGQASCWGYGAFGEIGDGSTKNATTPRTVGTTRSWFGGNRFVPERNLVDISAGSFFTCARNSSGSARCWGRNIAGQLGNGSTANESTPITVATVKNAIDITAGDRHACAVVSDGSMWCWGSNNYGQLADGTTTNRSTAVHSLRFATRAGRSQVLYGIRTASAGGLHTCVATDSDEQWCAGRNNYGQHGRGDTADTRVVTKTPVRAVQTSAGSSHTCARTLTGAVQCFGRDSYGQLGGFGACPATVSLALAEVNSTSGDDYARGGIHYLTGDGADLTLIASECATIDQVTLGTLSLGTAPDPDGGSRYYQVLSQTSLGDGTKRVLLRLHYGSSENGTTWPISVTVTGVGGDQATIQTTAVGVLDITDNGGRIHLAQNEIRNEVFAAMYGKFGDSNFYDRPKYPDLYDLDYDNLSVTLDSGGINFSGSAKARILGDVEVCDPTVYVSGTFKIVEDGPGITTEWVDGPVLDTDFPFLCSVASLGLLEIAAEIIDFTTDDNVQRRIDKRIRKLGEICEEPLGCNNVIKSITHLAGAVELEIKPLIKSISIRNVYDTDDIKDSDEFSSPMRRGLAIPPGQNLVFTTSETVLTCSIATATCTNDAVAVSGTGVFNRDVNPPVPTPWPSCSTPPCPYYHGRQGPWQNMRGARRDAELLPLPNHSVGALVGRTYTQTGDDVTDGVPFYAGDHLCVMPEVDADAVQLVFGRNDLNAPTGGWLGEYGTGEAIVTIGFPPVGIANLLDDCEQ